MLGNFLPNPNVSFLYERTGSLSIFTHTIWEMETWEEVSQTVHLSFAVFYLGSKAPHRKHTLHLCSSMTWVSGFPSVISKPAASTSLGNLLEIEIWGPHLTPTQSEILGLRPNSPCFHKPSWWFWAHSSLGSAVQVQFCLGLVEKSVKFWAS